MKLTEYWVRQSDISPEKIYNKFKNMMQENKKIKEIAQVFDISQAQALAFAKRHFNYRPEPAHKDWSKYPFYMGSDAETVVLLKHLYLEKGMSMRQIAHALGVSEYIIKRAIKIKLQLDRPAIDPNTKKPRDTENLFYSCVVFGAKEEALKRLH